jgi:hypothetical protein
MGIELAKLADDEIDTFFEDFMHQSISSCSSGPVQMKSTCVESKSETRVVSHGRQASNTEYVWDLLACC